MERNMYESRFNSRDQPTPGTGAERMGGDNTFPRSPTSNPFGGRAESVEQLVEGPAPESPITSRNGHSNLLGNFAPEQPRELTHLAPMDISKIDKRKMKRFRLTHNQTRYLMSEFARQAHPDAAHRERLSREIPGLSPRQVQVWFQNRRAKLKRMSSDDRDRMMRSRALPDEFPLLQTLHPYGSSKLTDAGPAPGEPYTAKHPEIKHIGYQSMHRNVAADAPGVNPSHNSTYNALPFSSPRPIVGLPSPISTVSVDRPTFPYLSTPNGIKHTRGNPFSSPPSREGFRPQSQQVAQQASIPRAFSELTNLTDSQGQHFSPPALNTEAFSHDAKGFFMPSHPDGIPRSLASAQVGHSSYIATGSASSSQPYPSPHKPDFSPPLNLIPYKYQMPMTPQTAGTASFSEQAMQASPEIINLPQQLSAPPEATTFSTSYLTSATSNTSYHSTAAGFLSPKSPNPKEASFGRWYGHRSRRSCSHPPDLIHAATATVS